MQIWETEKSTRTEMKVWWGFASLLICQLIKYIGHCIFSKFCRTQVLIACTH